MSGMNLRGMTLGMNTSGKRFAGRRPAIVHLRGTVFRMLGASIRQVVGRLLELRGKFGGPPRRITAGGMQTGVRALSISLQMKANLHYCARS